jgi:catechol 2,3-dioxygenase-like lactoylglutathione lyase family enzyme
MRWLLEVVNVPVADVERAVRFYADQVGFVVDHDTTAGPVRFAQLTPPGSGCSIVVGFSPMEPGALKGLQLVVADLREAHAHLVAAGVEVSPMRFHARDGSVRPPADDEVGEDLDNSGMCDFADPDGNTWVVQQISARGR